MSESGVFKFHASWKVPCANAAASLRAGRIGKASRRLRPGLNVVGYVMTTVRGSGVATARGWPLTSRLVAIALATFLS